MAGEWISPFDLGECEVYLAVFMNSSSHYSDTKTMTKGSTANFTISYRSFQVEVDQAGSVLVNRMGASVVSFQISVVPKYKANYPARISELYLDESTPDFMGGTVDKDTLIEQGEYPEPFITIRPFSPEILELKGLEGPRNSIGLVTILSQQQ